MNNKRNEEIENISEEMFNCLTIEGYDLAHTLYCNLNEEDKKFYKADYRNLLEILVKNDVVKRGLKLSCKNLSKYIEANTPDAILLDKLITFYKNICAILKFNEEEKHED